MASISIIRDQVERRVHGALTSYERTETQTVPTGIGPLDREVDGLPKGGLTQVCAPSDGSLGKTTLLVSIMAQLTARQECCALIDASDCFDPVSSAAAGVDLSRVLWVRCGQGPRLRSLEQALKAADIVLQNGGFGLVALDLGSIAEAAIRKVPLTTWFRFARVIERMPAALLVLTSYPAARSCARLTLRLFDFQDQWSNPQAIHHARIFSDVSSAIDIGVARAPRTPQPARQRFTATPVWA
jgi:hypothetical protein